MGFYRFLIGLAGFLFVATGCVMAIGPVATLAGGEALDQLSLLTGGLAAITALAGLPLLLGKLRPGFLNAPNHLSHPLLIVLFVGFIVGGVWLSMTYAGTVHGTLPGQLALAMIPCIATSAITAILILPISVLRVISATNPTEQRQAREALESTMPPDRGVVALSVAIATVLSMGLAALGLLFMAYAMGYLPEKPIVPIIEDSRSARKLAFAGLLICALVSIPLRKLHGPLLRPRSFHEVMLRLVVLGLAAGIPLWFAQAAIGSLLPPPFDRIHALRYEIAGGLIAAIAMLSAFIATRGPRLTDIGLTDQPTEADAPAAAPQAAPTKGRGSALNRPVKAKAVSIDVPDIGILMKAYRITDWLLLRLFGAALLGMAWMIHSINPDLLYKVGGMLYGIEPRTVTIIYAVWGALLLIPVLLPRFVSRPQTVVGGAAKAAILVGLAFLIMPGIDAAIDLHVPTDYRGVMHASVPKIFKAVSGIAVFSAMAIALFRQLGGTKIELDGMGRPAQRFSANDLRQLRQARMPG